MSLPDGVLSTTPVDSALLEPDSRERDDLRRDFERGGVALNDPTSGLNVRDWVVTTNGESVWVAPYPEELPKTLQFTGSEITEVSLAFDQNMSTAIAYVEAGVAKLWWFDTVANAKVVTTFAGARSPMVCMDDKRPVANATNDVILAYIRGANAYYRLQRERFNTEHLLGSVPGIGGRIVQLGMGVNGRLQFKVKFTPGATHAHLLTDTIYVLSGEDIVPMAGGPIVEATWRSRIYEFHSQPSPAWARVEGEYPARIRLIADGTVRHTSAPINSPAPFRVPALRAREWQLEVVGSNRVVSVSLANTREELT